ncbi:MAG TPA: 4Fe-4S dicluster domain-containing protein [Candidatus Onthocola gallistercoris]|uniref:4Fe-4S dicluster domain-containing protein n=1 Tax=Candidatus Onthocola gallistercoris TaxID=2840876 RepID=A0A9D1HHD2_9FIRM|nr:4Fe-4S dicluster domain-containing protein [Candidatus Onthocola gallistercoris]
MERKFATVIDKLKFQVNMEVAKQAFEGTLDERRDEIPYMVIPGNKPQYRCCVYREREIIRQRVRLAEGRMPVSDGNPKNIVQVIPAACEGCPISRFTVSENCQMCMAKKCESACKFGAISFSNGQAHIDPAKCKECGQCMKACPYNAIVDRMRPCKRACPVDAITMDEDGLAVIDENKCISCGQCVIGCPFGAISDRSFLVDVINLIRSGAKVYAMVAPAVEGQFGADVSVGMLREAVKDLGFEDMFEVSLGADFVSKNEALELEEKMKAGEKMTTSCCPAFVNMIKKHFPQVLDKMSTTISPMQATARLIKAMYPDAICVFIGPCIAKKSEVIDSVTFEGADYALTYQELLAMFDAKEIDPSAYKGEMQQGSRYGKNYSVSGGVTASVLRTYEERNVDLPVKVCKANGALECKKALMLLKVGRLPEDFIEGMACEGGCVSGPAMLEKSPKSMKDRKHQIDQADGRDIITNVDQYEAYHVDMHRK